MKWIVITLPDFIENESTSINQLFKAGIDLLHLRKPESNIEECKRLIQEIDKKWHKKIVVHDHFELCQEFHLHGIHLNRRNHEIPEGFQGSISQSCHSFKEVEQALQTISSKIGCIGWWRFYWSGAGRKFEGAWDGCYNCSAT